MVVDRADNFFSRIDRATRRLRAVLDLALARRAQRAGRLDARLQQWPTILMMRGRDTVDLTQRLERAVTGRLGQRAQRLDRLRRRLEARDVRRLVAGLRTRLVRADGRLGELVTRKRLTAAGRVATLTSRLDALSPLAVLGRGYAVCWNAARNGIIRAADAVTPGDTVHVTLAEGELTCRVEHAGPRG
jgi:exodeoxyribonuclease VII large subunit